jgi:hypothetical protein
MNGAVGPVSVEEQEVFLVVKCGCHGGLAGLGSGCGLVRG